MGLREQAAQDAQAILEDSSGFAWPFTLTSPTGVAAELRGFTQDIGQSIDPDTGQSVAGRRASVAASLRSLTALRLAPEAVADSDKKPWVVTFFDVLGVPAPWKVIEVLPDRAAGVVVLLLEVFHWQPIDGPDGALGLPSLQLLGSFAPGVVVLGALTLPSFGLAGGFTSLVVLQTSDLVLPSVGLGGEFSSLVELSGGLSLSGLELAGALTAVVEVSGPLLLPSLLLAGNVSPNVALSAALGLPSLQLSGGLSPQVTLSGTPIAPSLELAGGLTPVVGVSGSLLLPSLLLAGGVTPSVGLSGSLALPSLQLAGGVTAQVSLSGSPLLPSMGISGGVSPAVALSGSLALPSLQLAGGVSPSVALSGTPTLPSLALSGSFAPVPDPVTITGGAVSSWFRLAHANTTQAGSGYNRVEDVLNPSNPAVQTVDARRPVAATSANGLPILNCNTSRLTAPLIAANNGATKWGIGMHIKLTSAAGNPCPFSIDTNAAASARKVFAQRFGGDLACVFNAASTQARTGGPATLWALNTWAHYLLELNLDSGLAEDKRCVWSVDGIPIVSAFANVVGTPGSMPTAMPVPTGSMALLAQSVGGGNSVVALVGGNITLIGSPMAGITEGLLTPAARLGLSNYERPT